MPKFLRFQATWVALGLALGGALPVARAETLNPRSKAAEGTAPHRPEAFSLANGLRVVLLPDPEAPVLSSCMALDAAVRRDSEQRPGVARLVAELVRDGAQVGSQEPKALLARRGGALDMDFSHDALTYCTTVPSSEVEFALWLDASRFARISVTQEVHSKVVEELSAEFEQLDDAIETERAPRRLRALAFQGRPAYGRATLATPAQLAEIERAEIERFHREHYTAARAVLALVGDFDSNEVRGLVERHLGHVARGEAPADFQLEVPHQTTERFSMIEDPSAQVPAVWYGWVLPPPGTEQREALELVAMALTSESRLGSSIVGKGRAAESIESHLAGHKGPDLFSIHAVGTGAASLEHIQKAVDSELSKLGQFGLRADEWASLRAAQKQRRAVELASNVGRARALSRGALLGQDPEQVLEGHEAPNISNVNLARAVREYLHSRRRTVVEIYPKGWSDPWQTPMPTYHLVSSGENLIRIAAMHDTTVEVIAKMNGLDSKKPIYPGQNLKVPRSKARSVKSVVHTVRSGDTLSAIAKRYKVTVKSLADFNGIDPKRAIRPGDELRIPAASASSSGTSSQNQKSSPPSVRTHKVSAGETLGGIALRYGVTTSSLSAANGLGNKTTIRVGQELQIPSKTSPRAQPGPAAKTVHRVRAGETLGGIAKKYGTTIDKITQANGISQKKPIRIGQELVIPR